jgi:hypothetical protein
VILYFFSTLSLAGDVPGVSKSERHRVKFPADPGGHGA